MAMSQKEAVVSFTLDALKATSFQNGKDVALSASSVKLTTASF